MNKYRKKFEKIKVYTPKKRGNEFEKLVHEVLKDADVLVKPRFRTAGNTQEIDGAIILFERIFLVEVKWEESETLAASKLYSFLGKINSKIEGTLGVFISYNELSKNFINAFRDGIRQNCLLIHGPKNIEDIIDQKIELKDFLEYAFLQSSTKGIVDAKTSEYKPLIKPKGVSKNKWLRIYSDLVGGTEADDFMACLIEAYNKDLELSQKAITLYRTIDFTPLIKKKYELLIDELYKYEKSDLLNSVAYALGSKSWGDYNDDFFLDIVKKLKNEFSSENITTIIEGLAEPFETGDYNVENEISEILDIFSGKFDEKHISILLNMYINIYADSGRRDYFPQKRFADRLFHLINRNERYKELLKDSLSIQLKNVKKRFEDWRDEDESDEDIKSSVKSSYKSTYRDVFTEFDIDFKQFFEQNYPS